MEEILSWLGAGAFQALFYHSCLRSDVNEQYLTPYSWEQKRNPVPK